MSVILKNVRVVQPMYTVDGTQVGYQVADNGYSMTINGLAVSQQEFESTLRGLGAPAHEDALKVLEEVRKIANEMNWLGVVRLVARDIGVTAQDYAKALQRQAMEDAEESQ